MARNFAALQKKREQEEAKARPDTMESGKTVSVGA